MKKKSFTLVLILSLVIGLMSGCGDKDRYVAKVGEEEITKVEVLWYMYMIEKNLKSDADTYEKANEGKSYWDQTADNKTVSASIKEQVITMMTYNEIMSDQARKTERYKIEADALKGLEDDADEVMKDVPKKIEKMGLTKDTYVELQKKILLANLYYKDALALYDIDEDDIKEDNPYSKDKYSDKDTYEKTIDQMVVDKQEEKFNEEYKQLEDIYGVEMYDNWDDIKVGELADLM